PLLYWEQLQCSANQNTISIIYMVFPYYKDASLHDALAIKTRYTVRTLINLFLSICEGIQTIHEAQMAHRDIKPSNIMMISNTNCILLDFGSMTTSKIKVNTRQESQQWQDWAAENCCLQYRAPELFHIETGSVITEKTGPFDNVYSRGDSVALAVTSGIIEVPKSQALTYPTEIVELMLLMLQTDAEKRPTISDVIEKLQDVSRFTMDLV
ncbi:unnamed protein product, partial [Didymodactylos carnosus]